MTTLVREVAQQGRRPMRRDAGERVSPLKASLMGGFPEGDEHRGAKARWRLVLVGPRDGLTHTAHLAAGRARGNSGQYLPSWLPTRRLLCGATSLFYDVNSARSRLSCQRMPRACKRPSTHEQVQKSLYSIQMQDDPERHAQQDGYTLHLSPKEVQCTKGPADYSGF